MFCLKIRISARRRCSDLRLCKQHNIIELKLHDDGGSEKFIEKLVRNCPVCLETKSLASDLSLCFFTYSRHLRH